MKKNISRIITTSIALVLTVTLALTLTSCNKLNKYQKMINKSTETVNVIELDIKMTDKSQLVYERFTKTTISSGNATVEIATSKLNASFTLETSKTTEFIENINRNDVFKIDLNHKLLASYTKNKTQVTCEVTKENMVSVLKNADANLDMASNATLVLIFEDKKLMTVTCTYQTTSLKNVEISVNYTY